MPRQFRAQTPFPFRLYIRAGRFALVLAFPAADLRRDARLPEQRARLCKTFGGAWLRTASGLQAGALTAPRSLPAIKPAASTAGAAAGGPE